MPGQHIYSLSSLSAQLKSWSVNEWGKKIYNTLQQQEKRGRRRRRRCFQCWFVVVVHSLEAPKKQNNSRKKGLPGFYSYFLCAFLLFPVVASTTHLDWTHKQKCRFFLLLVVLSLPVRERNRFQMSDYNHQCWSAAAAVSVPLSVNRMSCGTLCRSPSVQWNGIGMSGRWEFLLFSDRC